VKKRVFVKLGCIALCTVFLTGCAGLKALDNPYVYSERTALYQSSAVSGRP